MAPFGNFTTVEKALDSGAALPPPIGTELASWGAAAESVLYVNTDPDKADTAVFCETYDVPLEASANCVIIATKGGGQTGLAACVVLAHTQLDVNRTVRKHLGVRKASFASMDTAVAETGMEYGGITPIGLPRTWPLLIDQAVAEAPHVLIGSGRRRGKLILPGRLLGELPGAEVVSGLAA